ncbi:MAG: DUF2806 domain-containing protein [Mesorhizobium sp.]|uniref:DUF2806 domain-containing protein n=1 Tax=Mesorhizobium sp. TaxID=1871066 RepID=UPI000FE3C762|nr:DUF2806 domain-containing protein [Mesorhizobium sp.]RWK14788.1 MAG: DUF2806 domain-containing protein [Mesorhizobium sp.]RWK32617.1 MAG: DUF2806 domain-containing protein [Mesorhizobium sp.]
MTGSDKKADNALEAAIDVDPTTGKVSGKLAVPESFAKGMGLAVSSAFAGLTPSLYRRAVDGKLKTRLDTALMDKLCEAIADTDVRSIASGLLLQQLIDQADRVEARARILELAADHFPTDENHDEPSDISDQFLRQFWQAADRATNDDVRTIFARILSQEIVNPGSFSATTLNLLTILHPRNAQRFEQFCRMTLSDGIESFLVITATHADRPHLEINSISSSSKIGEWLIDFGINREDLLDLVSIGLVRSSGEEEYWENERVFKTETYDLANRSAHLRPGHLALSGDGRSLGVISLTPTGHELRSVIALDPDFDYVAKLTSILKLADIDLVIT